MQRSREIVWTPELGAGGRLLGINVDHSFALKCERIVSTPELVKLCLDRVWGITKSENKDSKHPPSNLLFFDKGNMLTTMLQHPQDAGKWLDIVPFSLSMREETDYIQYSFHHSTDAFDDSYNRWLQFVFSRYVFFMQSYFERIN